MVRSKLTTPVLFLVFNRPSTTKVVFEIIRQAKPTKLYIAADGPRKDREGEYQKCQDVRSIATDVDWECEVKTLFRNENLGCGKGVSSGITWFFENEAEGIILEDDCVPNLSFFQFCTELLERYRDDKRVMEISGNNIRPRQFYQDNYSYSFSNHNGIWGWASWRRAWALYDYEMKLYTEVQDRKYLNKTYNSIFEENYFDWVFQRTFLFPHITWDYQWEFVKRINSGLTIIPHKNMVINIGFGADATNTTSSNSPSSNLTAELLDFPLRHPPYMMVDAEADKQQFIAHMTTFQSRMRSYVKKLLPLRLQNKILETSMRHFIETQESEPIKLKELKEKISKKIMFWVGMLVGCAPFEIDLELLSLVVF